MNGKTNKAWPIIGRCLRRLLAGLLLLPCSPLMANTLPTTLPSPGPWQPRSQALGRVTPERDVLLRLPFAARIGPPLVEVGTRVKKGRELARLTAPTLDRDLLSWLQADRERELARRDLALLRQGGKTHTVTRHDRLRGEQELARRSGAALLAWQALTADLRGLNIEADADDLTRRIQRLGRPSILAQLGRLLAPFDGLVT